MSKTQIPDDLMQKIDECLAAARVQMEIAYLRGRMDQQGTELERLRQRLHQPTIVMDRSTSARDLAKLGSK